MNKPADLNLVVTPLSTSTSTAQTTNGSTNNTSNSSGSVSNTDDNSIPISTSNDTTNLTTDTTTTTTATTITTTTTTTTTTNASLSESLTCEIAEDHVTPSSTNLDDSHISKSNLYENNVNTGGTVSNNSNSTPSTTSSNTTNQTTNTTVAATTTTTSASLSDSLASGTTEGKKTPSSTNHHHHYHYGNLSKTNLYIKGLQPETTDQDLYNMCSRFGHITSTKAILDYSSRACKGFGFVEFTTPQSAKSAVHELTKSGVQAQMAKLSPLYNLHHQHHHNHLQHNNNNNHTGNNTNVSSHNSSNNSYNNSFQHNQNSSNNNNNADPTNLYIANLPPNMSELELESLLSTYGPVVSTRILRNQSNVPLGVGFARMETRDKCEQIIEQLNGRPCKGWKEPLLVKFADGGNKKRHHHNHHNNQHQSNNNHHQHRKVHQYDNRWRDSNNTSVLGSGITSYEHQGNISHSNHLSDLPMMSTMSYPRMQAPFPRSVNTGAYPNNHSMGPSASAPQWIHPSGQPYVISQQMIQADGMGRTNQPALHYGHIPQLTSQMQALQIAHPEAPVGGYLPPQHQWPGLWTHPIPQQAQPSMRMNARIQPVPSTQQSKSPQSAPVQLQQQPQQQQPQQQQQQQHPQQVSQQSLGSESKLQVSMPL